MQAIQTLFTPRRITLLVAVIVLSVSIPLLIGGHTTLRHLASLSWPSLMWLLLLLVAKWGADVVRIKLLLRHYGIRFPGRDTLMLIWLCDAASESTPGGLGGPVTGWALLRSRQVPTTTIVGVGLLRWILDIVVIIFLTLWILLSTTSLHQQGAQWQLMVALAAMLLILALLWGMFHFRRKLIRLLGRLGAAFRLSPDTVKRHFRGPIRLWLRLGRILERMTLRSLPVLLALILSSMAYWCIRLSVLYVAALAMGQHIAWLDALSIQIITGFAGMAIGLPSGFLGADMTMAALLSPLLDIRTIASVVLLWRLMTLHATLLVGVLSFAWLKGFMSPAAGSLLDNKQ